MNGKKVDHSKVVELFLSNSSLTQKEIANMFDCSVSTVHNALSDWFQTNTGAAKFETSKTI